MAQVYEVTDPANPRRVLFSGPEEDARDFAEQHAPRPHGDNGHDVPLLHLGKEGANSGFEYFNGSEWGPVDAPAKKEVKS